MKNLRAISSFVLLAVAAIGSVTCRPVSTRKAWIHLREREARERDPNNLSFDSLTINAGHSNHPQYEDPHSYQDTQEAINHYQGNVVVEHLQEIESPAHGRVNDEAKRVQDLALRERKARKQAKGLGKMDKYPEGQARMLTPPEFKDLTPKGKDRKRREWLGLDAAAIIPEEFSRVSSVRIKIAHEYRMENNIHGRFMSMREALEETKGINDVADPDRFSDYVNRNTTVGEKVVHRVRGERGRRSKTDDKRSNKGKGKASASNDQIDHHEEEGHSDYYHGTEEDSASHQEPPQINTSGEGEYGTTWHGRNPLGLYAPTRPRSQVQVEKMEQNHLHPKEVIYYQDRYNY
jgi:hypothetical protein